MKIGQTHQHYKQTLLSMIPPYNLPYWRWLRLSILVSLDLFLVALSYWASFWIRLDSLWPKEFVLTGLRTVPLIIIIHFFVFLVGGLYKPVWRFATLHSAVLIARCTFLGTLISLMGIYLLRPDPMLPRSIMVIFWFFSTFAVAVTRFAWRAWNDFQANLSRTSKPVCIIYGAGKCGDLLARHIDMTPKFPYQAMGFIDDDINKRHRIIHGLKVLGTGDELENICQLHSVHTVIIAIPSAPGRIVREIVARCQAVGIKPLILPSLADSLGQNLFQPRPIDIKDLLRRSPKSIDHEKIHSLLEGKVILVTGAGGSIGSELCRQILQHKPDKLVLLDSSEFNLYHIDMELQDRYGAEIPIFPILGSVTDELTVQKVFSRFLPAMVFHAAAYKHVPVIESNPIQGIINNISGTKNVAEASVTFGVRKFLLISTDKAVNPTSIMGMTKRACELLIQSMHSLHTGSCSFSAVRFGNVLGSSGSVVPRFLDQIQSGGPVTVTHPEITRYFMLTSEAVGLVLQSTAMSKGGETFVLNMGEPVKIYDMAQQIIRLAGKEPGRDIEIVFTGLRPGEKLYEELIIKDTEKHILHDEIYVAIPQRFDEAMVLRTINEILKQASLGQEELSIRLLKAVISPIGTALSDSAIKSRIALDELI